MTKLGEAVASLEGVVDMAPVTLLVPQALLRNGQCGPHSPPQIVRCRALQVGMADRYVRSIKNDKTILKNENQRNFSIHDGWPFPFPFRITPTG